MTMMAALTASHLILLPRRSVGLLSPRKIRRGLSVALADHLAPEDRTEGGRPGRRQFLEGAAARTSSPSAMLSGWREFLQRRCQGPEAWGAGDRAAPEGEAAAGGGSRVDHIGAGGRALPRPLNPFRVKTIVSTFPEYVETAPARAEYKVIEDDVPRFASVPELPGIWASGRTVEECRKELIEVIEEWIVARLQRSLPIPPMGGQKIDFPLDRSPFSDLSQRER